jgi:hypothetical protein
VKAKFDTLDEYLDVLDAIKEKVAQHTHGMTAKQVKAYFADGARELQQTVRSSRKARQKPRKIAVKH